MLRAMGQRQAVAIIFGVALATIVGALIFEHLGYAPCDLCLKQRWAYYLAIPLALLLVLLSASLPRTVRVGLYGLALIWLGSAVFGIYHSGVEWGWWAGPNTCSGGGGLSGGLPDLSAAVVMCDKAALRIFGLSLAGWNAVISLGLALLAWITAQRYGSSSVSQ